MPLARISQMQGTAAGVAQKIRVIEYRTLAERLRNDLGVRMEDVSFSLVGVNREDRSFGDSVMPCAE